MRELTKSETVEKAKEATKYNLYELIGDEVYEWSDKKFEREALRSAGLILQLRRHNHPEIAGILRDRAMTLWLNDMMRVPKNHLTIDSEVEMLVSHNYWPNDMRRGRAREILEEHVGESEIPLDYFRQAWGECQEGIIQKLEDIPDK